MNILIAGEGGQGVQTIAEALSYAAFLAGLEASYLPQFGVEQRGTPTVAYIQIDKKKFTNQRFKIADIVVILRERAIPAAADSINPHTVIIFDSSTISPKALPQKSGEILGIPATQIAKEKFIPKVFNVIVLGALSKLVFDLKSEYLWQALEQYLGKKFAKNKELRKLNESALFEGQSFVFERRSFSKPIFKTETQPLIHKSSGKISTIYPTLCKGCGICIEKCPVKVISFSEKIGFFGNPVPQIDLEKCILCDNCRVFCPDTAIEVNGSK